jgi:hypothetical protein
MFDIFAQELKNPWEATPQSPAAEALALMEDNPFASFREMEFNVSLRWQPYDRAKALQEISTNPRAIVGLRTNEPFYLEGSLARHPTRNTFTLSPGDGFLSESGVLEESKDFVKRWQQVLPRFGWGGINADRAANDFYNAQGLAPLPDCFGSYLAWYTLISPLGYEPYFTPEDLEHIPAHSVRRLPDGSFSITSYPNPLAFDDASSRRAVAEITNYLNQRRKDWRT